MKIWVDADAAPLKIKEIIFKAAMRAQVKTELVANHFMRIPVSPYIKFKQVPSGLDVADSYIVEHSTKADLVITADIPLASEVVKKGAIALNPRGKIYTAESIGEALAMRNLRTELRDMGEISGGPKALGSKDIQAFANAFDKYLRANHSRN